MSTNDKCPDNKSTKVEIWLGNQYLDVIKDVDLDCDSNSYDHDLGELVKQWADENLYPRLIDRPPMSYTEAVAIYNNSFEVDRRFDRPGDPSESYSECIGGTWFLSAPPEFRGLLAHVTASGEVLLWQERLK